jgi:RNA polymerase sigma-70 factor (ECF subfamily)
VNPCQNHSDADLVTLLTGGDRKAFETIYRRYASDLYRYARKNVPLKEDCEEMVQDVFESLWLRRENLRIDALRHYLLKSVRYKVIRYFRKRGVQQRYIDHYKIFATLYDTIDSEKHNPEALQEMLVKSLAGLPERCQVAMKLRITENLSNQEVANRMNITKRTAELYMSKALCHLRTSFPELYKTG